MALLGNFFLRLSNSAGARPVAFCPSSFLKRFFLLELRQPFRDYEVTMTQAKASTVEILESDGGVLKPPHQPRAAYI